MVEKTGKSHLCSTYSTCACTFPNHRNNCVIWNDTIFDKEIENFNEGLKTPVSIRSSTQSINVEDRFIKNKKIREKRSESFPPRRFIFIRHGERLDYVFPEWFEKMVTTKKYVLTDLNQPDSLRHFNRSLEEFKLDTPLTNTGSIMSQLIGKNLHENNLVPDFIYCSPALRCIQTASLICIGAESKTLIRIEPGLYEENIWVGNCNNISPCMTMEQLTRSSIYGIDYDYKPFIQINDLFSKPEDYNEYNARIQMTIDNLIKNHDKDNSKKNKTFLIVGHASTVDVAIGYFSYPKRKISREEGKDITKYIPYHGGVTLERNKNGDWEKNFQSLKCYSMYKFDNTCDTKFILRDIIR
ncbi:Protein UBASH3A homolog [Strongyloides ratti]|uniref:Protein UBASH3A homolog n=1 Tax=Strongyloides ratti TaxID=34506 RepID=A0A090LL78_STRRB|nr:Protein UBASH3A homolog [Strongyloides ratti]CEF68928.1 Protein UBASH3A homolog [Strongyloides ratti]